MSLRKGGHVRWAFDFSNWKPTATDLLLATSCIQPEEKTRLARFVFRDDFNASIIGRLMMRKFVHLATGLDYEKIEFDRDHKGKPYLKNVGHLVDFNVSHQGRYAVLAGIVFDETVEPHPKIGVDIMKIEYSGGKALGDFFKLMDRNFSFEEWNYIKSRPDDGERLEAFMRNWCLKESYVKNVGVGITINLKKLDFSICTKQLDTRKVVCDSTLRVDGTLAEGWRFEESLIDKDHCAAVALENIPKDLDLTGHYFEIVNFQSLIEGHKPLLAIDENYCDGIINKEYKKTK
ncbi:L-aminoadipate-semialdehyde dehydrogenase-phosphopantetheinyl transferase [Uranotaenia lowii]|uniref:L-aminoadipate-semialdehyde dehydrogenase-phosphopantetheinyl transferase n=1 Tax=Uranotaenia lowii TaxID=190385 RepID=UPI0024796218|nr:L-aminoadipate-semialdehyde dehydrogenase-phosphopantetheinyl transferase [Uranotaenia lowii]